MWTLENVLVLTYILYCCLLDGYSFRVGDIHILKAFDWTKCVVEKNNHKMLINCVSHLYFLFVYFGLFIVFQRFEPFKGDKNLPASLEPSSSETEELPTSLRFGTLLLWATTHHLFVHCFNIFLFPSSIFSLRFLFRSANAGLIFTMVSICFPTMQQWIAVVFTFCYCSNRIYIFFNVINNAKLHLSPGCVSTQSAWFK